MILSACDSGVGEVKIGEGVMSLRRAFRIAGAETVLASHWKVSDQATGRLMSGFMRRWAHLKSNGESEPARPRWECARFIGVLPLQLAPLWSWLPSRSSAPANPVLWAVLRSVSGASGAALKAIFLLEL